MESLDLDNDTTNSNIYIKDYSKHNWKPLLYTTYYNILRETAIKHGYALAIHGSLLTDMDLIAVPWIEFPSHPEIMINEMTKSIGGCRLRHKDPYDPSYIQEKSHGRLPFSIHTGGGSYLDISVIPPHQIKEQNNR